MDERDYQFMNNELNQNKMEIKLDKTKLTYVRQQDRVQGNWYIVLEDVKSSTPWIVQWHSGDRSMDAWGTESVQVQLLVRHTSQPSRLSTIGFARPNQTTFERVELFLFGYTYRSA
jgi:hypothetical protein